MKIPKIALGIGLSLVSIAKGYDTPSNVKDYYMNLFPQTARVETVGRATVGESSYYIMWGSTENDPERPDDTEATLKVSADGTITRINDDVPSALPFWYISDKRVWNPLLQSFIDHQIKTLGEVGLQTDITTREFIAEPLAEAYEQRGFRINKGTKLLTNMKGDFVVQETTTPKNGTSPKDNAGNKTISPRENNTPTATEQNPTSMNWD